MLSVMHEPNFKKHLKKIFFILSLLIASELVLSQNTSFEKYYDFGAAETGYCVQQTPDSGFVVCGFQGISLFSSKIVVMKTDKNGILEWNKLFGDGSNDQYAYHIINCSAGGYAVVGYRTGIGFVRDIYVLRLDINGDTLWTKQYGTPFIEEGSSIKETADSGFVISYIDDNDSTGILKIDSVGNLLWWKKYYLNNGAYFKDVATLSTGGYLLSGVVQTGAGLLSQAILMRTDSVGDSLWVKTFGGIGGDEFYEAHQTIDGNLIAGGISGTTVITPYNIFLVKTNMNGDTIWTNSFGSPLEEGGYSISNCQDGGYIIAGIVTQASSSSQYDLYLAKADSNGDSIWSKQYGGALSEYGHSVQQTFDGGFVFCGTTGSLDPDGAGVYLVKTDSLGSMIIGIDELAKENLELSIFPNPTDGVIHLRFDILSDFEIEIINELGQIIFSEKIGDTSPEKSIDISSFQNGIYFLKVQGKQSYGVKKIIKIN